MVIFFCFFSPLISFVVADFMLSVSGAELATAMHDVSSQSFCNFLLRLLLRNSSFYIRCQSISHCC